MRPVAAQSGQAVGEKLHLRVQAPATADGHAADECLRIVRAAAIHVKQAATGDRILKSRDQPCRRAERRHEERAFTETESLCSSYMHKFRGRIDAQGTR